MMLNKYFFTFVFAVITAIIPFRSFASSDWQFIGNTDNGARVLLDVSSYENPDLKNGTVSYVIRIGNNSIRMDLDCLDARFRLLPENWTVAKKDTLGSGLVEKGCKNYVMRAASESDLGRNVASKTGMNCKVKENKMIEEPYLYERVGAYWLQQIVRQPICTDAYFELANYFDLSAQNIMLSFNADTGVVGAKQIETDAYRNLAIEMQRSLLSQAIRLMPSFTKAWIGLMGSYKPKNGKDGGNPINYLSVLERSLQGNEGNAELLALTAVNACDASRKVVEDKDWVAFSGMEPKFATIGQERIKQALHIAPKQVEVVYRAASCYEEMSGSLYLQKKQDTPEKRAFAHLAIANYKNASLLAGKPWDAAFFKSKAAKLHYHLGEAKEAIQLFKDVIPFAIQEPQKEWFEDYPNGFQVSFSPLLLNDMIGAYAQMNDKAGAIRLYEKIRLMSQKGLFTSKHYSIDDLRKKINEIWPGLVLGGFFNLRVES